MSYRIEIAKTGRAGCRDTYCKNNAIKIPKGGLRLGVWVETANFSSYTWKHWVRFLQCMDVVCSLTEQGCVTRQQISNMQKYLAHPSHEGEYRWDLMDGLQGEDDADQISSDLQEKFKTAIMEGHVAVEDVSHFEDQAADEESPEGETPAKSKPAPKKRGRAKAVEDDENSEEAAEPKKKRAKKGNKAEEEDEEPKPAKKSRAKKVKEEDLDDEDVEAKPAKKGRGRVKKEVVDENEDEVEAKPKPTAKKSRAKKAIKTEEESDLADLADQTVIKPEDESEDSKPIKKVPAKKKAGDAPVRRSVRSRTTSQQDAEANDVKMEEDDVAQNGEDLMKKEGKEIISQSVPEHPANQQGLLPPDFYLFGEDGMPSYEEYQALKAVQPETQTGLIPGLKDEDMFREYRELYEEEGYDNVPEEFRDYVTMRKDFKTSAEMWKAWKTFIKYNHSCKGDDYYGVFLNSDVTSMYYEREDTRWTDFDVYLQMRSEYSSYEKMSAAMDKWMVLKQGRKPRGFLGFVF